MPIKHDYARSAWQTATQPITGSGVFPGWEKINRIVVHYPGADFADMDFDNDSDIDWEDTKILLRNTQNYYVKSRGYSIGYNSAIGQEGNSWELRGDTFMCAANVEANRDSYAILLLVDGDDPANPRQVRKMRELVAQVRSLTGKQTPLVSHNSVAAHTTRTACPGSGILGQLASGAFEPRAAEPDIPSGNPVLRRGVVHDDVRKLRAWLLWLNFMQRKPDRRFGQRTEAAVKALQRRVKVKEDGVYGPVTAKAMSTWLKSMGY